MKTKFFVLMQDNLNEIVITNNINHSAFSDSRFGIFVRHFDSRADAELFVSKLLAGDYLSEDEYDDNIYGEQYNYACGYVN